MINVIQDNSFNAYMKIRAHKKLLGSLGRIAVLGSYRIWLARHSQEWTGGELIR